MEAVHRGGYGVTEYLGFGSDLCFIINVELLYLQQVISHVNGDKGIK